MYRSIESLVKSSQFQSFIIGLIILNGISMGLETSKTIMSSYSSFILTFDKFVIAIFTLEIALRIFVYRVSFFKDPWSLFDFFIVLISLFPANESFAIFRILRVFRLFRLITVVPQMRKIVSALLSVIPGMLSIMALMSLIFYIFAIMATNLYGENFPEWFGTLGDSFYTLFQVMTLESWSMGIVRPIMEQHPYAWLFFIPFIFLATFVMINLIVAVIVDAMAVLKTEEESNIITEVRGSENSIHDEIKELKSEIKELKEFLINKKRD
ncbi:ion transporter [Halarcobacter ebronensis]|uniref:Ion transporter n=1 Tax=Halarcobacter ebronensis TaxID=1462615 RepID=A0A4Q0YC49_9BACT|nr:ion transporter [Halarcobacter ebronensis]RXJ67937.1 ion transporter [Halarcobacter ebronensis]